MIANAGLHYMYNHRSTESVFGEEDEKGAFRFKYAAFPANRLEQISNEAAVNFNRCSL